MSHVDTPYICQILNAYVKEHNRCCLHRIHGENIILILWSKVKVILSHEITWHIVPHLKRGRTMLKDKKAVARTQSYIINSKSYRNVGDTSSHDKRPMCQIWLTNVKSKIKNFGRTRIHVKILINLILRELVNVLSGSWMYVTHLLMVIDPCDKYGKNKFDLEVQGQRCIGFMNVRDTSTHVINPYAKYV